MRKRNDNLPRNSLGIVVNQQIFIRDETPSECPYLLESEYPPQERISYFGA